MVITFEHIFLIVHCLNLCNKSKIFLVKRLIYLFYTLSKLMHFRYIYNYLLIFSKGFYMHAHICKTIKK